MQGTIVRANAPKEVTVKNGRNAGKSMLVYTADVRTNAGEFKLSRFGKSFADLVGAVVEFNDDQFNEQYATYNVKTITKLEGGSSTVNTAVLEQAPRGVDPLPKVLLEDTIGEAQAIMALYIDKAKEILGDGASISDVIALALGVKEINTTLFIEKNKERRFQER